jgi:chaperonin GroEL (HSP60 family)
LVPINRLLENAGYSQEESLGILEKLADDSEIVYDVENQAFGKAEELGIFDSAAAVEEALKNASGIATVMGTMGGIVAFPRDNEFEKEEARADAAFKFVNEADQRP